MLKFSLFIAYLFIALLTITAVIFSIDGYLTFFNIK